MLVFTNKLFSPALFIFLTALMLSHLWHNNEDVSDVSGLCPGSDWGRVWSDITAPSHSAELGVMVPASSRSPGLRTAIMARPNSLWVIAAASEPVSIRRTGPSYLDTHPCLSKFEHIVDSGISCYVSALSALSATRPASALSRSLLC